MRPFLKTYPSTLSFSQFILRIVVGITFIAHGAPKFVGGFSGTIGFFTSLGIPAPGFFAVFIAVLETVGGAAIILGLGVRFISFLHFFEMLVAMFVVHIPNGFFVSNNGYELVLLLALGSLAIAISGAGDFSLDNYLLQRVANAKVGQAESAIVAKPRKQLSGD